jgi:hypothetical protein
VRALTGQERLDHRTDVVKQLSRARIHALTQRRARWQQPDAQRGLVERITPVALDGIEVALALREQTQVAAQDVAACFLALRPFHEAA